MKLDIKKIEKDGKTYIAGWDLIPENEYEEEQICVMRDAIFFGLDETAIEYAGRTQTDEHPEWSIGKLMWRARMLKDKHGCFNDENVTSYII